MENTNTEAFTIECMNEEAVHVDEASARVILKHSEYFRNLFRHGTREAKERRIKKSDWSIENTTRMVELLSKMRVTVPLSDAQTVFELVESTNQILVPWRIDVKLKGSPFPLALDAKLTRRLMAAIVQSKSKLVIETQMRGLSWKLLLEHGYFLLDRQASVTFDRLKSNIPQEVGARQLALRLPRCEYEVCVASPCIPELPAVANNVCKGLHVVESKMDEVAQDRQFYSFHHRRRPHVFSEESFSLRLSLGISRRKRKLDNNKRPTADAKASCCEGKDYVISLFKEMCFDDIDVSDLNDEGPVSKLKRGILERILAKTGADGFFFDSRKKNPGYFMEHSEDHDMYPTFTGTPSQLRDCLHSLVQEEQESTEEAKYKISINHQICSLRVAAPTNDTLGHLIEACGSCEEHRGTLGVDIRSKAYYAVKTVFDMQQLLKYLADAPQKKGADQDIEKDEDAPLFRLKELIQPGGAF